MPVTIFRTGREGHGHNSKNAPGRTSAPRVADAHLFETGSGAAILRVDDSSIFEISPSKAEAIDMCLEFGDAVRVRSLLATSGIELLARPFAPPPTEVPVHTISLAIAQKCNLGCTYCYAEQGTFGQAAKSMTDETARKAVDRLFEGVNEGETLTVVFLGGEPLANRSGLQAATRYAATKAMQKRIRLRFAITTNATLMTREDVSFFEDYGFTVTISVDGIGSANDALRPFKSGKGSYEQIIRRAEMLLSIPERRTKVYARATVTPQNLELLTTLKELAELGFDGVQFSPLLSSPTGTGKMCRSDLQKFLDQSIECGRLVEKQIGSHSDSWIPFTNFISTIKRIHAGERDDYPCGAGGSYLGVSATGDYAACHRFVGDEAGAMGDVETGIDGKLRRQWLSERHLEAQSPCVSCWARRLCGGSCHYEVINAGRPACDYIRGWLHFCLGAYVRLLKNHPDKLRRILGEEFSNVE